MITPKDQYAEKKKARLISNETAAECSGEVVLAKGGRRVVLV